MRQLSCQASTSVHTSQSTLYRYMHTTTPTDNTLMSAIKGAIPIVLLIITATSQYFTLQGQIIELRAKYEASTSTTKDAIDELKSNVRETNNLLRDVIRSQEKDK